MHQQSCYGEPSYISSYDSKSKFSEGITNSKGKVEIILTEELTSLHPPVTAGKRRIA